MKKNIIQAKAALQARNKKPSHNAHLQSTSIAIFKSVRSNEYLDSADNIYDILEYITDDESIAEREEALEAYRLNKHTKKDRMSFLTTFQSERYEGQSRDLKNFEVPFIVFDCDDVLDEKTGHLVVQAVAEYKHTFAVCKSFRGAGFHVYVNANFIAEDADDFKEKSKEVVYDFLDFLLPKLRKIAIDNVKEFKSFDTLAGAFVQGADFIPKFFKKAFGLGIYYNENTLEETEYKTTDEFFEYLYGEEGKDEEQLEDDEHLRNNFERLIDIVFNDKKMEDGFIGDFIDGSTFMSCGQLIAFEHTTLLHFNDNTKPFFVSTIEEAKAPTVTDEDDEDDQQILSKAFREHKQPTFIDEGDEDEYEDVFMDDNAHEEELVEITAYDEAPIDRSDEEDPFEALEEIEEFADTRTYFKVKDKITEITSDKTRDEILREMLYGSEALEIERNYYISRGLKVPDNLCVPVQAPISLIEDEVIEETEQLRVPPTAETDLLYVPEIKKEKVLQSSKKEKISVVKVPPTPATDILSVPENKSKSSKKLPKEDVIDNKKEVMARDKGMLKVINQDAVARMHANKEAIVKFFSKEREENENWVDEGEIEKYLSTKKYMVEGLNPFEIFKDSYIDTKRRTLEFIPASNNFEVRDTQSSRIIRMLTNKLFIEKNGKEFNRDYVKNRYDKNRESLLFHEMQTLAFIVGIRLNIRFSQFEDYILKNGVKFRGEIVRKTVAIFNSARQVGWKALLKGDISSSVYLSEDFYNKFNKTTEHYNKKFKEDITKAKHDELEPHFILKPNQKLGQVPEFAEMLADTSKAFVIADPSSGKTNGVTKVRLLQKRRNEKVVLMLPTVELVYEKAHDKAFLEQIKDFKVVSAYSKNHPSMQELTETDLLITTYDTGYSYIYNKKLKNMTNRFIHLIVDEQHVIEQSKKFRDIVEQIKLILDDERPTTTIMSATPINLYDNAYQDFSAIVARYENVQRRDLYGVETNDTLIYIYEKIKESDKVGRNFMAKINNLQMIEKLRTMLENDGLYAEVKVGSGDRNNEYRSELKKRKFTHKNNSNIILTTSVFQDGASVPYTLHDIVFVANSGTDSATAHSVIQLANRDDRNTSTANKTMTILSTFRKKGEGYHAEEHTNKATKPGTNLSDASYSITNSQGLYTATFEKLVFETSITRFFDFKDFSYVKMDKKRTQKGAISLREINRKSFSNDYQEHNRRRSRLEKDFEIKLTDQQFKRAVNDATSAMSLDTNLKAEMLLTRITAKKAHTQNFQNAVMSCRDSKLNANEIAHDTFLPVHKYIKETFKISRPVVVKRLIDICFVTQPTFLTILTRNTKPTGKRIVNTKIPEFDLIKDFIDENKAQSKTTYKDFLKEAKITEVMSADHLTDCYHRYFKTPALKKHVTTLIEMHVLHNYNKKIEFKRTQMRTKEGRLNLFKLIEK